jgi:hypothetical protein
MQTAAVISNPHESFLFNYLYKGDFSFGVSFVGVEKFSTGNRAERGPVGVDKTEGFF